MKEPYSAQELDQKVTFLRETQTDDGMGGKSKALVPFAENIWAKVRPMSGREREHADRLNAEANYLIVIRRRSDIDETVIAVWNERQYNIRFVRDTPRSRFMVLEVERGVTV